MKTTITSALLILLTCIVPCFAQTGAGPRLAVLDLRAEEGISEGEARLLSGKLRAYISETGAFTLINREDVEAIAQNHEIELAICAEDACLLEVGTLLGAQKLLVGNVGELWGEFSLNVRLVDLADNSLRNELVKSVSFTPDTHEATLRGLAEEIGGGRQITTRQRPFEPTPRETVPDETADTSPDPVSETRVRPELLLKKHWFWGWRYSTNGTDFLKVGNGRDLMELVSDEPLAVAEIEAYRKKTGRAVKLNIAALGCYIVAGAIGAQGGEESAPAVAGLLLGGVGLATTGLIYQGKAVPHLQRSVGIYNASGVRYGLGLVPPPAGRDRRVGLGLALLF